MDIHPKLLAAVVALGFDPEELPFDDVIEKEWEQLPIIKALRAAEQSTSISWGDKIDYALIACELVYGCWGYGELSHDARGAVELALCKNDTTKL